MTNLGDFLTGLILGGVVSAAGSWVLVGRQLSALSVEVVSLRRDVDRIEKRIP